MRKRLGLMIAGTLLLGACGAEDETTEPATEEVSDMDEEVETETEDTGDEMETDTDTDEETEADTDTTAEDETDDETETDTDTAEDDEPEEDTASENTDAEETQDDSMAELDEDIRATLNQDFEEINWDDVHLTRSEFDASLTELQRSFNEDYEEEEDMDVRINNVDFSGDTLEITLTNDDDSEYAEMTSNFLAAFLDSFYRQLYLRSDYSDGSTHPRIIIQTNDGEVITDETDFVEYDIQEEIMDSMD